MVRMTSPPDAVPRSLTSAVYTDAPPTTICARPARAEYNHLRRLAGATFTDSAYCQARARLPLELFRRLLRRIAVGLQATADDTGRWRGHRVFVADGSGVSMPDTPELRDHFG